MRRRTTLAALALLPVLAGGFLVQDRASTESARLLDQVFGLVSQRFVDTVSAASLYEKAARGMVKELNDPYAELFTPKELAAFSQATNGRYAGIGMQIEDRNGNITITTVFPNSPAEAGGVRVEDRIIQVDTLSTRGWKTQQVSDYLIGVPDTKVNVKFSRPGVAEPISMNFVRKVIHIPAVPYAIVLDNRIGYVLVQRFNDTAAEEVANAVAQLQKQGVKGVILDLRGNPGGILEQSITMSNLFLKKGQGILSVRGRAAESQGYVARSEPAFPDIPLTILQDEGSASASEIVAGALQDHDRAVVIGATSFGKGLVQTLFPLDGGYALKLTTAKWYTPSGRTIQRERKYVNGRFVEEAPDSAETEAKKRARPAFRSDAGRIVYGGGGITPDVLVRDDTLTSAEQAFNKAIAPKSQEFYVALADFAQKVAPGLTREFTVQPQWRGEFYGLITQRGVVVDRAQYDAASRYVDWRLEQRIARTVAGDSAAKRRDLKFDAPLRRALEMMQKGATQKDLFTLASAGAPGARVQ